VILNYVMGRGASCYQEEKFHEAIARWVFSLRAITAININGLLIRFAFLFSLCVALGHDAWTGLLNLVRTGRFLYSSAKLVALALLALIFALTFQYIGF
jgi:hypothetical protein